MGIWPFKRRKRSPSADRQRPAPDELAASSRSPISRASSRSRRSPLLSRWKRNRHEDRRDDRPFPTPSPPPQIGSSILLSIHGDSPDIDMHDYDNSSSPHYAQHHHNHSHSPAVSFPSPDLHSESIDSLPAFPPQPEKKPGFFRRLSGRRKKDPSKKSPPAAYYNSRLGRRDSKRSRHGPDIPGREFDRPISDYSNSPRSSIESDLSRRAYKVRSLDVFSPHPTLRYEDASSLVSGKSRDFSAPSRSNSRRTNSRAQRSLLPEDRVGDRNSRVDDLVEELDAAGLREAMERDRRRREKRKKEYEERVRLKLERKAMYQQGEMYRDMSHSRPAESSTAQRDLGIGYATTSGPQTPLSWFNDDDAFAENVSREPKFERPGVDMVTPVSMEPPEDYQQERQIPEIIEEPAQTPPEKTRSGWRSFFAIPKTKKEKAPEQIHPGQSALLSNTSGEDEDSEELQYSTAQATPSPAPGTYLDVERLRHHEGRTPNRHVAPEVVLAMKALETGHIQDRTSDQYADELRDSAPPLAPYNTSQRSSLNSLHHPTLRGGGIGIASALSFEDTRDSPTLPSHHSSYRYSPPMHRSVSGASSPENRPPRSVMSTSLASIDSEGSWLSGRIGNRTSIQHLSPLRTSASSLRKRYNELPEDDAGVDDGYFTGVRGKEEETRLDLGDSDEEEVDSEDERNMWRDGMKRRVEMKSPTRAESSAAVLGEEFGGEIGLAIGGMEEERRF